MKVTRRYDQHRRDLKIDLECENCQATDTYKSAYDDLNFWQNVVPGFRCPSCNKSSNDLGIKPEDVHTKYAADEVV